MFEKIISLENLFFAWSEFKLGKKSKPDVQTFEFNLEDNLFKLHQELKNKSFQHSKYTPFYITDPKLRHIHKATVRDRVLHHALFRILYPIFDKTFIYDSYSCRNKKGTHRAVYKLQGFIRESSRYYNHNIFALKCDVSKYFDSIDHSILLRLIRQEINDKNTLWLIERILNSFEKEKGKGIPLGNVTGQLFANVYLNELDHFVKDKLKIKHYIRYCDDFVFLSRSKEELERLILVIREFLESRLKLQLHPKKIIFAKLTQGIDFLGYVNLPNYIVLRTRTKKRMFKRIKGNTNNQALQSYLGMLSHGNNLKLKKKLIKIYQTGRMGNQLLDTTTSLTKSSI